MFAWLTALPRAHRARSCREITYVNKCRDGPGCSSAPGVAFDTAGVDMYHPATQCDTPCVLHHDPLLPIDAIPGGFVDRHEYYEEINRMRSDTKPN